MPALLLWGDTVRSAALRHEIPLAIISPVLFAEVDGRPVVLTSWLERDRVTRALPDPRCSTSSTSAGRTSSREGCRSPRPTVRRWPGRCVGSESRKQPYPGDFPLALGDHLRDDGVVLTVDDDTVELRRRAKSVVELDGIRTAQRAAEAGMTAARKLLARARPNDDGRLELEGEELLAEDVRAALCAPSTGRRVRPR